MMAEFQFIDFLIMNIDYKATSLSNETDDDNNLEFAYGVSHEENTYTLSILTSISNVQKDHILKIRVESKGKFAFENNCKMDDNEKIKIIKSNGSAIMFPYIRSIITNLTSADTHNESVILPTMNFSKIIEEIDKNGLENKINEEPTPNE